MKNEMNMQTVDVEIFYAEDTAWFGWDWNGDEYMSQFECDMSEFEGWVRTTYYGELEVMGEWDADEDGQYWYELDFDRAFMALNKQYKYQIGAEFLAYKNIHTQIAA